MWAGRACGLAHAATRWTIFVPVGWSSDSLGPRKTMHCTSLNAYARATYWLACRRRMTHNSRAAASQPQESLAACIFFAPLSGVGATTTTMDDGDTTAGQCRIILASFVQSCCCRGCDHGQSLPSGTQAAGGGYWTDSWEIDGRGLPLGEFQSAIQEPN